MRLEGNPIRIRDFTPVPSATSLVVLDKQGNPFDPGGDNPKLALAQGPILDVRSVERLDAGMGDDLAATARKL